MAAVAPASIDTMIVFEGLADMERTLKLVAPETYKGLVLGLHQAAEPVKRDADRLALSDISGMRRARKTERRRGGLIGPLRPAWSVQRIGQTQHEVYIAPVERGVKSRTDPRFRRPKFTQVMLGKSYEPALARNEAQVRETVDYTIGSVIRTL